MGLVSRQPHSTSVTARKRTPASSETQEHDHTHRPIAPGNGSGSPPPWDLDRSGGLCIERLRGHPWPPQPWLGGGAAKVHLASLGRLPAARSCFVAAAGPFMAPAARRLSGTQRAAGSRRVPSASPRLDEHPRRNGPPSRSGRTQSAARKAAGGRRAAKPAGARDGPAGAINGGGGSRTRVP
jgi:hypothetical protein